MDYMNYNDSTEENGKHSYRFVFFISAIAVLGIILVIATAFLMNSGIKAQKYNSAIASGNNCYNSGDYQNAIVQYELAVEIDKNKSTGYLNMASAYMGLGDFDSAVEVLIKGMTYIQDERMEERLGQLQSLINVKFESDDVHRLTVDEIAAASENVTVENSYLDMIAAYTYTEYYRDFGTAQNINAADGKVLLSYDNIGIETIYYDLGSEKVLDNSGNMPVATSKPCLVRFRSLVMLFSGSGESFAISFEKLNELLGGHAVLSYDDVNNRFFVTAEYKHCKVSVETDEKGNIVSEYAWNELEPLSRGTVTDNADTDGSVSGYVKNAMTGIGMKATLKIRSRGSRTGDVIAEITSGNDGSYTYEGLSGTYTAEVSAAGYVTEYFDIEIITGQTKTGKNIILAPVAAEGEIRIVLSWGSTPSDLDSHAEGHSSSGQSFHIFFSNKSVRGVGELDLDDTNGYGPETLTITDAGAEFTYSVVDYTNSGTISSSGATVRVYLPDGTVQSFTVPSGSGNTWKVFSYQNGQISQINTIS